MSAILPKIILPTSEVIPMHVTKVLPLPPESGITFFTKATCTEITIENSMIQQTVKMTHNVDVRHKVTE